MISKQPYKITILDTHHQEQFLVNNALERYRILSNLQKAEEPISVFIPSEDGGENPSFVSTLLHVDKDQLSIRLETAQQAELTEKAANAPYLLCSTQLNKVKIEFRVDQPTLMSQDGVDSLAAALPETVVRIQRREYYRLRIPTNITLQCTIHVEHYDIRFDLFDVSCGGISGQLIDIDLELHPGMVLEDSQIDIPQIGSVTVDLQVRNISIRTDDQGHEIRQIGFSFIELPEYASNAIQRFVYAREREQTNR